MEINKIITLGNEEKYLVIDKVTKDEKDYYYVAEVNEDETNIKDNYKIITTTTKEDDNFVDEHAVAPIASSNSVYTPIIEEGDDFLKRIIIDIRSKIFLQTCL